MTLASTPNYQGVFVARNSSSPISGRLPKKIGAKNIVQMFQRTMGYLSFGHLARLLECDRIYLSRWNHNKHFPSSLYLSRMMTLTNLKMFENINFSEIYAIDWEEWEFISNHDYENGNYTTKERWDISGRQDQSRIAIPSPRQGSPF